MPLTCTDHDHISISITRPITSSNYQQKKKKHVRAVNTLHTWKKSKSDAQYSYDRDEICFPIAINFVGD